MTTIAPKSSIIASASKKILSGSGTCLLSNAIMPRAKAMSVAIGIAQPFTKLGSCLAMNQYTIAGIIIPPIAAIAGKIACW